MATLAGALFLGLLHGLAFAPAPFPAWFLPFLQLAAFGALSWLVWRAPTLKRALWTGFCFGAGTFAVGVSWIYVSLHVHAYMVAPLAAMGVGLLSAYLSLYPTLAAGAAWWLAQRPGEPSGRRAGALACVLAMAAAWTGAEWLRGVLFTGFPWLNAGYAHVDGPLRGWAPLAGVYGVAFAAALAASGLAWLAAAALRRAERPAALKAARPAAAAALLALAGGIAASFVSWVRPEGAPLPVRLVQANIPLSEKFDPAQIWNGMDKHRGLAEQPRADGQPIVLTLLPETAVPVLQDQLTPAAWQEWIDSAAVHGGVFAMGVAMRDARQHERDRYYNSVIAFDGRARPEDLVAGKVAQRYDKHHLVPFGEYVPPGFRWFVNEMVMPLGDFDRGPVRQTPFAAGGQRIAMNICYEDVFGEELLPALRASGGDPGATILANVSNLAWFGDSLALPQHLQMSRMRVRETGRPMLRATNTGMTAAIAADARVIGTLAPHTAGVLDVTVQGTTGLTPYARAGNAPILILVAGLLAVLGWLRLAPAKRRMPRAS